MRAIKCSCWSISRFACVMTMARQVLACTDTIPRPPLHDSVFFSGGLDASNVWPQEGVQRTSFHKGCNYACTPDVVYTHLNCDIQHMVYTLIPNHVEVRTRWDKVEAFCNCGFDISGLPFNPDAADIKRHVQVAVHNYQFIKQYRGVRLHSDVV